MIGKATRPKVAKRKTKEVRWIPSWHAQVLLIAILAVGVSMSLIDGKHDKLLMRGLFWAGLVICLFTQHYSIASSRRRIRQHKSIEDLARTLNTTALDVERFVAEQGIVPAYRYHGTLLYDPAEVKLDQILLRPALAEPELLRPVVNSDSNAPDLLLRPNMADVAAHDVADVGSAP